MTAKDLRVAPIASRDANALIRKLHYSGKLVVNSQLHLGVFLGTRLEGTMSPVPRGQALSESHRKANLSIQLKRAMCEAQERLRASPGNHGSQWRRRRILRSGR
jgi:hypothetical protein